MKYTSDKLTRKQVSTSNRNYQIVQQGIWHDGINIFCYPYPLFFVLISVITIERAPPFDFSFKNLRIENLNMEVLKYIVADNIKKYRKKPE